MPLLLRKSLILIKAESTYGTDITPAGTDAVLVRDLTITPMQSDIVSRDLVRPYLGASEQLLANTRVQCQFTVELAGSGTAGTAPRFDAALEACGLDGTLNSAVTGTAAAGTTTNSIVLAVGATDDMYVGQVITITGGTGNGHVGLITDYVASTKVATVRPITATFVPAPSSTYSIAANATYKPVSASFTSATIYYNVDGLLHRITGARGTFSLSGEVGAIPTIQFTMTGIYNAPTDTAAPSPVTYTNQATPQIFKQGNTTAFQLYSYADACLQSVSMDIGNNIVYRELVGCTKQVLITQRNVTGTVVIEVPTIAQKDYFTAAITDGSTGNFSFAHGTTAGNRVGLVLSTVDIGDPSYSGQDDIAMLNLPYTAIPTSAGNDEFALVFS